MKIFIRVFFAVIGVIAISLFAFLLYYLILTADVRLGNDGRFCTQSEVVLYDGKDELFCRCGGSGESGIAYGELNKHTIDAFLTAEDKNFFRHNGLNYRRIAAALWKNVMTLSFKEGASTISQQLVKNTLLSPEKTLDRKLKEIKLTKELEKRYSKEEILTAYLNTIYFGHGCFGIKEAAAFYFDEDVEELNVAQSAMLAALIRSPNNYSPFRHPEKCLHRRNWLLSVMAKEGKITLSERDQGMKTALPEEAHPKSDGTERYVAALLEELERVCPDDIYRLKIYTYLDKELQNELKNQSFESDTDKSFCVIDGKNGGIKAFFSTVGRIKRSPASLIKPLLVYAPAIEEDLISPGTPILDEKIDFGGYSPQNPDRQYHGYVSCREALAKSYNVPAVRILNALQPKKGVVYLEKAGLPVADEDVNLALALGGTSKGYDLPELCAAYTSFSSGEYRGCALIRRVTDDNGKELYRREDVSNPVFSADTVTLVNDMLKEAVRTGTAKKLKNLPFDLCAKTGTVGNRQGNTDAYCLSYTAEDVVGVWLGNADNTPMENVQGGGLPANINREILRFLYRDHSPDPPPVSDDVVECVLDKKEYEENHRMILCDENAPVQEKTISYLFKRKNAPRLTSTSFSKPKSGKYSVFIENNCICVELCQTEYQSVIVNRRDKNGFKTVYQGKSIEKIYDNDVSDGETYYYSVTPYYREFVGDTVELTPVVYHKKSAEDEFPDG